MSELASESSRRAPGAATESGETAPEGWNNVTDGCSDSGASCTMTMASTWRFVRTQTPMWTLSREGNASSPVTIHGFVHRRPDASHVSRGDTPARLNTDLFTAVEQDLHPVEPHIPLTIGARTAGYLRGCGLGPVRRWPYRPPM